MQNHLALIGRLKYYKYILTLILENYSVSYVNFTNFMKRGK